MMTLEQALHRLAQEMNLDGDELATFAAEDTETGWDYGLGDWHIGSMFAEEGRILYALIRALKPEAVVEFGTYYGCSAKHILKALVANKRGRLVSVDPAPMVMGERFTAAEKKRWTMVRGEGETAELPITEAGLVLEDAMHTPEMTEALVRRGLELHPRILLSHDGEHFIIGKDVRTGFSRATGGLVRTIITKNADCGFAYWIAPQ